MHFILDISPKGTSSHSAFKTSKTSVEYFDVDTGHHPSNFHRQMEFGGTYRTLWFDIKTLKHVFSLM